MDELFKKVKRKSIEELNIVPILDMLISIIFFLILTTSFMQLTKQSVPPSKVQTITDPLVPPPLTPKLICTKNQNQLKLSLVWSGTNPGRIDKDVPQTESTDGILNTSKEVIDEFLKQYPNEKTLQIGLGSDVAYQNLISIMDAAKERMPDMVLFSYLEAQARANQK